MNTHCLDNEALILLDDGALVAILVELADECHGADRGKWVIEAAFAVDEAPRPTNFPTATAAADWLTTHVPCARFLLGGPLPRLH